ncbi:Adhesion G-protein coupled receptor G4 [Holothuria leucospilota]|uniref:Adhesion G-protein coupled receptor G4 n=1 Tax=Holothuria leucospilota TaxID=206669 RepID=A0A9Q1BGV3_HOLLE|nr:Adhesion G-protein coupled receptor G4 [Holothuria leucospilota]
MKQRMDSIGTSISFVQVSMAMIVVMMPLGNSQTVTTTQASMTVRRNCADDEYICGNNICSSYNFVCDGFDDCGDFSDERFCDVNECQRSFFSGYDGEGSIGQRCFQEISIFFDENAVSSKVTFVLTDYEKVLLTRVIVFGSSFFGICRVNVTTPSETSVAYQQSNVTNGELLNAALRSPVVQQGDVVTITLECSEDPQIIPWIQQNISSITVRGIPMNSSCEDNRECITSLFSIPEYPDYCVQSQTTRRIADQFQHCFEHQDITVNPAPFLMLSKDNALNNYLFCEAEYYSEIEWYKLESQFHEPKRVGAGKFLNFSTNFTFEDQGSYVCLVSGTGGSRYVLSTRVIVTIQGIDTYLDTLVFDDQYQFEGSTQYQHEGSIQYQYEGSMQNQYEWSLQYQNYVESPQYQNYFEFTEECVNGLFMSESSGLSGFAIQRQFMEMETDDVIILFYLGVESSQSTEEVERNLRQIDFLGNCEYPLNFTSFQSASFCQMEILEVEGDGLLVDLTFEKTNIGVNASSKELCPSHSPYAGMPLASRRCEGDLRSPSFWQDVVVFDCFKGDKLDCLDKDENSDDSCVEQLFNFLKKEPVTDENVVEISEILAEVTEKEALDKDDLIRVLEILELIVQVNSPSPEVTQNVVETVDNIINVGEDVYRDLVFNDFAPSRFVRALETQLTNLQMGESSENFTVVRKHVAAFAVRLDEAILGTNVTFGSIFSMDMEDIGGSLEEGAISLTTGTYDLMDDILKASITLPSGILDEMSFEGPNDTVPVTFLLYRTGLLFMNNKTYEERQRDKVGSIILAATVEGQSIRNLTNPVVSRFRLLPGEDVIEKSSRRCVFWNFSLAYGFGAWSSEGCELINVSDDNNESIAECHCNHLTNFAVLLSPQEEENLGLRILSIIGCAVSIPALLMIIVIFLAVKKLRRKVPQQILVNLCFALLGLYLIFLIYLSSTGLSKVGCIIIGALIHYFCLASVAWMCVEATNMYLLFVKVFDAKISGFLWKAMLAAWG